MIRRISVEARRAPVRLIRQISVEARRGASSLDSADFRRSAAVTGALDLADLVEARRGASSLDSAELRRGAAGVSSLDSADVVEARRASVRLIWRMSSKRGRPPARLIRRSSVRAGAGRAGG